ncbi:MAG: hypothetical protein JW814_10445 [Candidatus Krumholzibacteriota bacterium]|nr:hypothetical protein [Candidatus Krumholzibacteriota bacterium]
MGENKRENIMVELVFRNIKVTHGNDVYTDMEINPGDADLLQVYADFPGNLRLYHQNFVSGNAIRQTNFHLKTRRPVFQFTKGNKIVARVQIDFQPGSARILGICEGKVSVR